MTTTYQEYDLPAHWASALINADESGLDDEDIEALDAWLDAEDAGICMDVEGEPFFMNHHDASQFVLACDCLRYVFRKEE